MLLTIGLLALFAALVLGIVALTDLRTTRTGSAQAVTLLRLYTTTGPESEETSGSALLAGLATLGRRVTALVSRPSSRSTLQRRLDLAGNPARWTAERVLAVKGCGLLGGGVLGALLAGSLAAAIPVALAAAAAGFLLPDLLLYNAGLKRREAIQRGLADSLDLLVISVQAGLGFDAAIAQVARNTRGPLAGEFSRLLQEMQLGTSRREAFAALGERTGAVDVRHFVGAIVQADALGIPVSAVLEQQAREMRTRRRQAAEEQAQKVPVKILFPLMALVLPSLFIVVLGPAALQIVGAFSGAP